MSTYNTMSACLSAMIGGSGNLFSLVCLSKDVHFKDLGVMIIDEEQKFGVSAKEKLKQIRATVLFYSKCVRLLTVSSDKIISHEAIDFLELLKSPQKI